MGRNNATVICHFRNEEVLLPYWLRHHRRLFDHGVMVDYSSTDRSVEIVRELAPGWEIRPSRNREFHSLSVDREVMEIEEGIRGWKMVLNATEFLLHYDLKAFIGDFESRFPDVLGLVTTGFVIQDSPDQLNTPLENDALWAQRHFGCPEPDPGDNGHVGRRRLLHKASHGRYGPGRHSNGVSSIAEPPLYLFWYGWSPLSLKIQRNRDCAAMVPSSDLERGWGKHHVLDEDQVRAVWRNRYLLHCYDLLNGTWPVLNSVIEKMSDLSLGQPPTPGRRAPAAPSVGLPAGLPMS